jgi:hypothetical protein
VALPDYYLILPLMSMVFPKKNILMLNFQEKTMFASKMQGKHILMQDFHP